MEVTVLITELYTKRLYLRKMKDSDSTSLFPIWSDPDVIKFMNVNTFTDETHVKYMIQYLNKLALENKALRFTIIERYSNIIIGSCGYNSFDFENGTTEIGYDIAKAFWGKGYAPEAISCLLHHAFTSLKLKRVEAKVDPQNINSIKVLQKLNFSFAGVINEQGETSSPLNLYIKEKGND